jgi:DNA-binding transcriptional ArsR family regulator
MPRNCTVCAHEKRAEIDSKLVDRAASYRDIASQFGLNYSAIGRHVSSGHISELIAMAADAEQAAHADTLLDRIEALQRRTEEALTKAEESEDAFATFRGISEMRRNLELIGEVSKQLDRKPTVNLHLNPEWIEVRTNIVLALERHPEARESVLRALEGVGNGNGSH